MKKIYANVMVAKIYNTIVGDIKKRLVVFKDGRVFEGALFWPMDADDMIMEIVSVNHVEGTVWDVMIEAYASLKANGMLAKDDQTLKSMLHWQHVNGFSDEMFIDAYGTKNDTEYFERRRANRL